jgi:hypothetical protein
MIKLVDILEEGKSVTLHPLLKEFICEKVKQEKPQQVLNIKLDSLNVKKKYYDNFPSLVQEYEERNGDINSIREDFEIAFLWLKELVTAKNSDTIKLPQLDMEPIYQLY